MGLGPRQLWGAWRAMGPFRRSHHPACGPFRADVLRVRGKAYCIACWVGYPALAAAAIAALALGRTLDAPWWAWGAAGLVLALPQALSFAGKVPSPVAQVAVKLALGAGFGLVLASALLAPVPWWARLLGALLTMSALNTLWLLRFHRLERTCQACPQVGLRPRCEGLRDLDDRVGAIVRLPRASATWEPVDAGAASPVSAVDQPRT